MNKQVKHARWIEITGNKGIEFVLYDGVYGRNDKTLFPTKSDVQDFVWSDEIDDIRIIDGYGARLVSDSFLSKTDWMVFSTKDEAEKALEEAPENL